MKNVLIFDWETTISSKGNPFDKTNKAVVLGLKWRGIKESIILYQEDFHLIQGYIDKASVLVGFNAKFDLHWLRKVGVDISKVTVWDCQLGEFILNNQKTPYPSLNDALAKYGFPLKLDVVKTEYWERRCSCHVSIVEKIFHIMQEDYACSAILDSMSKGIEKKEMLINVHGEQLILNVMKKLSEGEVRNYLMILRQRLEHIEHTTNESTSFLTVSMIDLWLKKLAVFVEVLKTWPLTTAIQRDKLETDCVLLVTQLWHILRGPNGWKKHNHICEPTPVDTDQVPRNILTEYLTGDLEGTESVFEEQFKQFENDSRKTLFKLHCLDLLVLEEMEWNGIKFNTEKAKAKADEIEKELVEINQELMGMVGDVPINFNSNVHLSALLYGGSFSVDFRIPIGVYKSGAKIGHVRHKILEKVYDFPRLVEPIKGTETAASQKKSLETGAEPSQWEVNDTVLRKLKLSKEAKKIVALLKRNSELEKLRGTYLIGYSNLIEKMNWPADTLHGTLNQCRVVTGRLSSASPNLQNADPTTKVYMETRYI